MTRWARTNVGNITLSTLLAVVGFLSIWCFNSVIAANQSIAALSKEYVRKDELLRLENKLDRLDEKYELILRECK